MKTVKVLLSGILILFNIESKATHIIGGEITVQWVSGNTFHLTLHFYRDCANGQADFDNPATLGIYDKVTNANNQCLSLALTSRDTLKLGDSCYRPNLCVELGRYETDVIIPNNPDGYYISYNRCCRNAIITNIQNPIAASEAWYAEVPDPSLHNSTPVFKDYGVGYFCINHNNIDTLTCTDVDGDSLVYSLVTPLNGNTSQTNSVDVCPDPGPYPPVSWQAPYSEANMIGGSPAMSINSQTGILTATPNTLGVFVFCVLVEEFRRSDKVKLGEIRRDIQYAVLSCGSPCGTGINNLSDKETFSLFPNPANTQLTLSSSFIHSKTTNVSFLNLLGEEMPGYSFTFGEGRGEADISKLPAGIYFLQLTAENRRWMARFVKE